MRIYIAEFNVADNQDRRTVEDMAGFYYTDRTMFYGECQKRGLHVSELWTLQEFTERLNDEIYPENSWVVPIQIVK